MRLLVLQSDPLAVHVTARVGLHHPVRDFDWHSGAEERQISRPTARQVRQRVRKMSKFAKCSPLE